MEKWETDVFDWEDKKQRDKKLFYLVEKKNEMIENIFCINLLTYSYYINLLKIVYKKKKIVYEEKKKKRKPTAHLKKKTKNKQRLDMCGGKRGVNG